MTAISEQANMTSALTNNTINCRPSDKNIFSKVFSAGTKAAGKDRPPLFFLSRSSKISQEFSSVPPLTHAPKLSPSHAPTLTSINTRACMQRKKRFFSLKKKGFSHLLDALKPHSVVYLCECWNTLTQSHKPFNIAVV